MKRGILYSVSVSNTFRNGTSGTGVIIKNNKVAKEMIRNLNGFPIVKREQLLVQKLFTGNNKLCSSKVKIPVSFYSCSCRNLFEKGINLNRNCKSFNHCHRHRHCDFGFGFGESRVEFCTSSNSGILRGRRESETRRKYGIKSEPATEKQSQKLEEKKEEEIGNTCNFIGEKRSEILGDCELNLNINPVPGIMEVTELAEENEVGESKERNQDEVNAMKEIKLVKETAGKIELDLATNFQNLDLEFDIVEEENSKDEALKRQESWSNKSSRDSIKRKINEENLKLWDEIMVKTNGKQADYPHFKILRNRPLTDATAVFHHNAWDNIEWDDEMQTQAEDAVSKNTQTVMLDEKKIMLEEEADEHWDKFYQIHQNKFFKDRNWLFAEFPELEGPFGCSVSQEEFLTGLRAKRMNESFPGENSGFRILEVGCGAGNTVFPLLNGNNNPEVYLYCCDFSKTAVDIVKNHEKFEINRCTSFVLDITEENPVTPFPPGSLDVITCIFVMSAISPEKFTQTIMNLHKFLKPGGLMLFRDYGRYDLAQLRFKDGRCISDNFYMRGDGTRVYFFTPDEVENLFVTRGFSKRAIYVDRRLQVNRSKQLKMYRVWVLAKFCKLDS